MNEHKQIPPQCNNKRSETSTHWHCQQQTKSDNVSISSQREIDHKKKSTQKALEENFFICANA